MSLVRAPMFVPRSRLKCYSCVCRYGSWKRDIKFMLEICYMCPPRLHNNCVGCIVSIYTLVPRHLTVAYLFSCVNICNRTWTSLRIPFLYAFTKLRKATISFVMSVRSSVRPHGTTRLPLDEFSWNLIFECFSKICRENSSLIKIWQE